ncbi:MAG: hypothetical protein KDJ44_22255 [Rhodoblastus sp.]|nr:hypothetical protein [Rhodoblastus sp.]
MTERLHLPPLLNKIAEVAGVVAAVQIAEARGGTRVHLPTRARDGHWLVECVGREAADKICAHFRAESGSGGLLGCYVDVPLGPKNFYAQARRRALEMRDEKSKAQIALELRVSERVVRKWFEDRTDERQGSLF